MRKRIKYIKNMSIKTIIDIIYYIRHIYNMIKINFLQISDIIRKCFVKRLKIAFLTDLNTIIYDYN